MTLKAVIFDMDGVLVDSEPYHYEAETLIFGELGISVPDAVRNSFVGMSGRKMWESIRDRYSLSSTVEELLGFDRELRLRYFSTVKSMVPIPGATELLRDLRARGIRTGLASSSIRELIALITGATGLDLYFDVVVSGEEVAHGKPAPDIFIRAADILGAAPKECIVIEDSANGVKAANAAGMVCVGFNNPGARGQDLSAADIVVDGYATLDAAILMDLVKIP
ncbi:MAG: HAD family phosphatase [Spirochaetes bacterium]|nr:MAG: HAD family phosphatase [Spirochaetota bacterium]